MHNPVFEHSDTLSFALLACIILHMNGWERSGSVVECLTRDGGAAGSSLTGVTALWSLSKTQDPSLIQVQPRKTCPCLTERLLMRRKESNQSNKQKHINGKQFRCSVFTFFSI